MEFNIKINHREFFVTTQELTVLQECEKRGIYIPRFCYHDKLSIAGNCRMCLVELENSAKPVIACSTSLSPNMSIFTNSQVVRQIRENILEFLLINHPLDCPICDQGGECDLQDQSMVFGSDRGRFKEYKRSVEDKNFGPFVKTIMTRCIHCTRCVRFFDEIAGAPYLGTMGRGRDTEISTYLSMPLVSEISGNVIDLCPVGALTSRPYAFTSRPWELLSFETIDIFDSLGSNIRVDVKGNTIMRILPKLNENINEEWISDLIRFSYDGLRRDRLTLPMVRVNKKKKSILRYTSWNFIFGFITLFVNSSLLSNFIVYSGEMVDLYSLFLFRYWLDSIKCYVFFFCTNRFSSTNRLNRTLMSTPVTSIPSFKDILIYGINLKEELSVMNIRIRKHKWESKDSVNVHYIGPRIMFNYKYKHLGLGLAVVLAILKGKHFLCSSIFKSNYCIFQNANLNTPLNLLSNYQSISLNCVNTFIDPIHYSLIGLVDANNYQGGYLSSNLSSGGMNICYLYNYNSYVRSFVWDMYYTIYHGHHGSWNAMVSDMVLPCFSYTEDYGFFMNLEGKVQVSQKVIYGPSFSKASSDIFSYYIDKPYISTVLNEEFFKDIFNWFIPVSFYTSSLETFKLQEKLFSSYKYTPFSLNSMHFYKVRNNLISKNALNYNV